MAAEPGAVVVRFAPSPTGRLHLGNARTALLNWCFARQRGGRFLLRFDDTDRARSRAEYAAGIAEDLAWLGIVPDAVVYQSQRLPLYAAAAERLKAAGRLYPCYETEAELERQRRLARASHRPPVYGRAALKLTADERARLEAEGRRPHWRFLLEEGRVAWDDLVRGPQQIDLASLSDPVLLREDNTPLYTFTSVVDDGERGVTHVIRGEDHVTNTAVQIGLFAALGLPLPAFGHHNLLTSASGAGLSKRNASLSLATLRDEGFEPQAVAALAALTGSAEAVRPVSDLDELAELVDLTRLSRAPARIDEGELLAVNTRIVHALPFAAVAERLAAAGIGGGEAFWLAVRGNCERVEDACGWWAVVAGDVAASGEDPALAAAAVSLLPPPPWDDDTWRQWTAAVGVATGRRGRDLYHPLRLALTGRDAGPELATLLPLIGPERARARLSAAGRAARL
jgi:glutamyl-tRNA synthetase